MFSISHPSEDTFRLEIHGSPSELDPAERARLRAVLLALARECQAASEKRSSEEQAPMRRPSPSTKDEASDE